MADDNVVKNGSVWAWKPGATPETRVTSQFPSLPPNPRLRGYQEAAAEGLTGIKTSDQDGFSMADIIKLFGSRSSGSARSRTGCWTPCAGTSLRPRPSNSSNLKTRSSTSAAHSLLFLAHTRTPTHTQ